MKIAYLLLRPAFCLIILLMSNLAMATEEVAVDRKIKNAQAEAFVNKISKEVVDIINITNLSDAHKEDKLVELFNANVDTQWMAKFVLGRYNRTIKPELKEKYLNLYHVYLVRSYVPRFRDYGSRDFKVIRINNKGKGDYLVKMKLTGGAGKPEIEVDYRIREIAKDEFRLVDVIGEGISMISTQRSDFGGMISRKGLNYFVDKLQVKVDKLLKKNS